MIPTPTRTGTDGRTLDAILANASPETRATIEVLGEILGRHPASALSPTSFAIHHLGIDATHLASTKYSGPGTSLAILGNLLRIELERHADAVIIGSPGDGQPPTWSQLDIGGDDKVAVPGRVIASELIAGDPANRYTTILADANTMRHMIAELYASSETFGPTLVVLDDIDLVLGHRDSNGDNGALADFLATLDGVLEREDILTIATTNDPKALDPAAQRSARFDMVVTVPMPDEASRALILARHLAPLGLSIDYDAVARTLEGATGADVKEVVRRTVLEYGERFTEDQLLDVAKTGRWQAAVNRRRYLS
ncbi:MAG: AAA family ATPase [Planctomycetia bacterium]